MSTTLYLLRQQPDRISSSLFHADDAERDIVLLEKAISTAPSSMKGVRVAGAGMVGDPSHPTMTFDDLIEKIFSSEHVIVI